MSASTTKPLFVETTIHIWRLTATNASRQRIRSTIKSAECVTSTYVQAEYVNTCLRAAVEAYNCIVASEDYDDALGRWERFYAGQYKLGIRFLIISLFRDNKEREAVLRRLRELIEHRLLLPFDPRTQEFTIIDPTNCAAAQARPQFAGKTYTLQLDFPPSTSPPGLQHFLSQSHPLLAQIEAAITSTDKHWKPVKTGLQKILRNEYQLGVRTWRKVSDVVIALEAQQASCEVYSGNVKHFELICNAIQIPLKTESQQ